MLLENGQFYYFPFMLNKLWIQLSLKCHTHVPLQPCPCTVCASFWLGAVVEFFVQTKAETHLTTYTSSCQHLTKKKKKKLSDNILWHPMSQNKDIKGQFIKNFMYNFHKAYVLKILNLAYLANQHLMPTGIWVSSQAKSFGSQPARSESFLLN